MNRKLRNSIFVIFLIFPGSLFSQSVDLLPGIDVLIKNNFEGLKGKRIGLITNPTGVTHDLKSTIDILHESDEVKLSALFGPEHGVRGDHPAGEHVDFYKDPKTNLPVYSLYGANYTASDEILSQLDVLVYDIQDIGIRSYTYISTMGLMMEAAAKNNLEFVVLDRPNPLGGLRLEGNIVEDGFFSFVSAFGIPYVYGMTCGELAYMLNEENMLSQGLKCSLTVIKMEGWERHETFPDLKLEWIPTSPHIPHKYSPFYCLSTGIVGELLTFSIGVGYTLPFQTFAASWIEPEAFAARMNSLNLEGVVFRPISYKPYYSIGAGEILHGVQIHLLVPEKLNLLEVQFYLLQEHNKLYPEKNPFSIASQNRISMFDKVMGTDQIRILFEKRFEVEDIKDYLNKDIETFKEKSKKYYLYN